MSSMFKKKGSLAFKPKIPTTRPRPVNATSAPAPQNDESQPSIDQPLGTASNDASTNSSFELQTITNTPKQPAPSIASSPQTAAGKKLPTDVESAAGLSTKSVPPTADTPSESASLSATSAVRVIHSLQVATDGESTTVQAANSIPAPQSPRSNLLPLATPEEPPSRNADGASSPPSADIGAHRPAEDPVVLSVPSLSPEPVASTAKKNQKRAAPRTSDDGDGTTKPPKRQRKKAAKRDGDAPPLPRTRKRKERKKDNADDGGDSVAKRKGRKGRSPTPEDAENQVVDLQQLKMADLTKDLRIGKKFSRHDELRDRERKARARNKPSKEGDQDQVDEASESANVAPDTRANVPECGKSSAPAAAAATGPQFRIVDGQIVLDQSSLLMDRHARAAAAHAGENMETIEENDFTRLITSSSFASTSKLKGPNIWTDTETELFYRGLRMFGTEFEMISKMFPGKQRRHVKLKFNREERHNPKRIDAALIGEKTIKLDLDEYRAFTGADFEPVETIEAEKRKIQEAYEQERQRIADEQAEDMRKKREELFADDDGDETLIGRKKKAGKKRGKQAVAYGLNGEPIAQD